MVERGWRRDQVGTVLGHVKDILTAVESNDERAAAALGVDPPTAPDRSTIARPTCILLEAAGR